LDFHAVMHWAPTPRSNATTCPPVPSAPPACSRSSHRTPTPTTSSTRTQTSPRPPVPVKRSCSVIIGEPLPATTPTW
jgi:hypothetical protein